MNFPKLIILQDLLSPGLMATDRLSKILSKIKTTNIDDIDRYGMFTLGVSTFETLLTDIIEYLLQAVPEKLSFKEIKLNKSDLSSSFYASDITSRLSEKDVMSASYKNAEEFIKYFSNITSCNNIFSQEKIFDLMEIKASRNLLLHNNLKINERYKAKAGPKSRAKESEKFLSIDSEYLQHTIECLQYFIERVNSSLGKKYSKYTKVHLFKSTWECFFHSPVMKFEDYWYIDEDKDTILSIKKCKYEKTLSSGETSLLYFWRFLFTNDSKYLKRFNFRCIGPIYKKNAVFLMRLFENNAFNNY